MRQKQTGIQVNITGRITVLLLCAFLITLPLDRFYSQLVLAALMLHTIIHLPAGKFRKIPWPLLILLSSFFLLNIIGMIGSPDTKEATRDMQRQLAILIFPFLLYFTTIDLQVYRHKLMQAFTLSCCVIVIYLIGHAVFTIYQNNLPFHSILSGYFINHNFSEPIGIHATYLSMYLSLSLAFCFLRFLEHRSGRVFVIAMILILTAGLIQLASRSVLIATCVYCMAGLLFFIAQKKIKPAYGIVFVVLAAIITLGFTSIGTLENRLILGLKKDLATSVIEPGYQEPRIERWRCAYSIIHESPFFGHGSGTEKRLLKEKYYERKLYNSFLRELNAHNQYLSAWIKWGIAGLLVLLLTLALSARRAIQTKDALFFAFLVLISVVFFSENVVDVNKGIFFYAFFLSFFWLSGKPLTVFQRFTGRATDAKT